MQVGRSGGCAGRRLRGADPDGGRAPPPETRRRVVEQRVDHGSGQQGQHERQHLAAHDDATTAGRVGSVVWNELLAGDSAEAARFYERVFGYQARAIERRGGDYILLHASGDVRAGILGKPVPEWESQWLTYFGVADPAAAAVRAEALGGRIVIPPSPDLREGTVAVVTDPSGAVLVLQPRPRPN
jgi:predicted enzyme related to lactoylglutathione lyase